MVYGSPSFSLLVFLNWSFCLIAFICCSLKFKGPQNKQEIEKQLKTKLARTSKHHVWTLFRYHDRHTKRLSVGSQHFQRNRLQPQLRVSLCRRLLLSQPHPAFPAVLPKSLATAQLRAISADSPTSPVCELPAVDSPWEQCWMTSSVALRAAWNTCRTASPYGLVMVRFLSSWYYFCFRSMLSLMESKDCQYVEVM